MPQWCICCLISSSKKGGKIQTGLNCEYDGLSEVVLSLSHFRAKRDNQLQKLHKSMVPWFKFFQVLSLDSSSLVTLLPNYAIGDFHLALHKCTAK